jgi:predicted secreted protein
MRPQHIVHLLFALGACLATSAVHAQDRDQNPNWLSLKPVLFSERPVQPNATNIVQVIAPERAGNAAVLPVIIRARIDQEPERYIEPTADGQLRAEVVDSSELRFEQVVAVRAPK